jgi:hypothetical protein
MYNPNKIKVLCFLENDYGRDVEILMPLIYFAENYLNCEISFKLIWDIHSIYLEKPHLILLPNTIGSTFHFQISKYAFLNQIPIFALISEGNFRTDGSFNYWGYNTDKKFYQEYVCHWSKRTKSYFDKELPELGEKNIFTGATGFDRYKIYQFISKKEYLKEKNLSHFKKVIGYAGWAFGKLFNKQGFEELSYFHNNDPEKIKWLEDQMYQVESILKDAIERNEDILFILKRHPTEINPSIVGEGMNEMIRLKEYKNVLYITEYESIHDLISISDVWLGFETTTALEAWLMGRKPTIMINPDPNFNRDEIYKGSLIVKNSIELQNAINEFYLKEKLLAFLDPELENNRKELIYNTIGFGDGLNHIRTGFYLKKVTEKINPDQSVKVKFSFKYFTMHTLMEIGKYFYNRKLFEKLPKFKKTIWIFENFRLKNINVLKKKYYPYLETFYKEKDLPQQMVKNDFWNNLMN